MLPPPNPSQPLQDGITLKSNPAETKSEPEVTENSTKNKKLCRVCKAPADTSTLLLFLSDIGYGWSTERVWLCDAHVEHLDDSQADELYLKHKLVHVRKSRVAKASATNKNIGKPR